MAAYECDPPRDHRFPWDAVVTRDSVRLMRAVARITQDPDATPGEMSRRLRGLQREGVLPVDCVLTPGTMVQVVSPDVVEHDGLRLVYIRFWNDRVHGYEIATFPLTCLGDRRTKGSRRKGQHPDSSWKEPPWRRQERASLA